MRTTKAAFAELSKPMAHPSLIVFSTFFSGRRSLPDRLALHVRSTVRAVPDGGAPVGRQKGSLRRVVTAAWTLSLAMLWLTDASYGQGVDRIRRRTGVDSGKITKVRPLGVTIARGGSETNVTTEEIVSIVFAGEPSELNTARNAVQSRRFDDAREALAKIDRSKIEREEILAEVEFYDALAVGRLAQGGVGDAAAAREEVKTFLSRRATSFHVPEAIELQGDLLASAGDIAAARGQYALLAKAKSPYFQLRSALLTGQAWQAAGDHGAAAKEFERVLADTSEGAVLEPLRLEARLGRAVSRSSKGELAAATQDIGALIAETEPANEKLLARAYNALGDCYLQSGDSKGALYSYLHVDLLFANVTMEHAKALRHLATLWKTLGHPARAQEAEQALTEKYPQATGAK